MTEKPPQSKTAGPGKPPYSRGAAQADEPRGLRKENQLLRELVTVYRQLSGLAVQDADLGSIVQLLAERTASTVGVVSSVMDVLAAASPGVPQEKAARIISEAVVHPRLGHVLRASRQGHRPLRLPSTGGMPAIIIAAILVGDDVPAHLLTLDPTGKNVGEDMSLLVTEHAATICGVILGRERIVAASARRVRDDLVEGLLLGRGRDEDEAARWASHLGYDSNRDHYVLVIAFDVPAGMPAPDAEALRQRIRYALEYFLTTHAPEAIVAAREAEVVHVAPGGDRMSDPRELGAACLDRLAELFPQVKAVAGIGGTCRDPGQIAGSYSQAHRTTETLRRLGRSGALSAFYDLGIHRLLVQVPDTRELRGFADDVIGGLRRDEPSRRAEYLATLACYLRENGSPQRAAAKLHVHPNTVTYRVKRIEELTGLSMSSYADRLMTQVALEILDALGDGP